MHTSLSMTKTTVPACKTRFLVISDTHSTDLLTNIHVKPTRGFRHPLPACDVVLHCGDLTNTGKIEEYRTTLDMLKEIPAELRLVIAGNHDLSLDPEWWANSKGPTYGWKPKGSRPVEIYEEARELWTGKEAKDAGVHFLDEGMHSFTLKSGAHFTVYASPYQPEYCGWAFPYHHYQDRFNPASEMALKNTSNIAENMVPNWPNVDIMMTHGPPYHVKDNCASGDVGCHHLLRAVTRAKPRMHCFGHIHEGHGATMGKWKKDFVPFGVPHSSSDSGFPFTPNDIQIDRKKAAEDRAVYVDGSAGSQHELDFGKSTLFVNAAIMDKDTEPVNAPFVVDMDLPLAE